MQQQGRVQLDADWNEQTAILLHYLRTLAADLMGPFAGPQGSSGFEITRESLKDDFNIGKGRYYVDGILCENEKPTPYKYQKDYPILSGKPEAGKDCLVYLDVWERHITALEDDYIREKALGGPDTATRTKVVWQVKIDDGNGKNDALAWTRDAIHKHWSIWIERWQPRHLGCLMARVDKPEEDSKDPCLTAPDAKYRGQENQLYRVEIHHEGILGEATFKWSRDNGAVVSQVELSGTELIAEKPRGFAAEIWVELSNDGQELRGEPGTLVKLLKVEGDRFTLESSISPLSAIPPGEVWPTKARRWDQRKSDSLVPKDDGAVALKEDEWLELENGIQIQFIGKKQGHRYRTGDYWLIPARVATGKIEWPVKLDSAGEPELDNESNVIPIPQPPVGIRHHYAPLAILKTDGTADDCRCEIPPLNSCKMLSAGEEGMGGRPLCDTATTQKRISKASTKSGEADETAGHRRGKPK